MRECTPAHLDAGLGLVVPHLHQSVVGTGHEVGAVAACAVRNKQSQLVQCDVETRAARRLPASSAGRIHTDNRTFHMDHLKRL